METDYPPFDYSIADRPAGFSIDLLNLIAEKAGLQLEYVNGHVWHEFIDLFKAGEIDLLHSLVKTENRQKFSLFSQDYRRMKSHFVIRRDSPALKEMSQLKGKVVAVGKGWMQDGFIQTHYPDIKLLRVNSVEEMLEAVSSGQAYATVENNDVVNYWLVKKGFHDLKISGWARELDRGEPYKFHFMGQKNAPELISILNKGIESLSVEELQNLEKKWFAVNSVAVDTDPRVELSPTETAYLEKHKQVTMCIDPDWLPYEAIAKGKHTGIGGDLLRLIAQRAGVELVLVKSKTWSESLKLFKAHKCQILSMLNKTDERNTYMDYTQSYVDGHVVFVANNDHPYIADASEISGKTVVTARGYSINEFLARDFKDIKMIEVDTYETAFEMVASGKAELTADYLFSAGDRIQKMGLFNLKIAGNTPYRNDFHIGVQKDLPVLRSILNKAISSLRPHEVTAIINSWRTIRYEQGFDYSLLWKVLIVAFVILIGFTYWTRRLHTLNAALHIATQKAEDALNELAVKNKELEKLSITDRLTGLYNRHKLDELLLKEFHRSERFKHPFSVILIDVDHFKHVNDTHGHQVGDKVLVELASLFMRNLRETDAVGRWGGEEVILILPGTVPDKAIKLAEILRRRVAKHDFTVVGNVTASFGISGYLEGDSIAKTLSRADEALYAAKANGRNRVEQL